MIKDKERFGIEEEDFKALWYIDEGSICFTKYDLEEVMKVCFKEEKESGASLSKAEKKYKVTQNRWRSKKVIIETIGEEEVKRLGFWSTELEEKGMDCFDGFYSYTIVERIVNKEDLPEINNKELYRILVNSKEDISLHNAIVEEIMNRRPEVKDNSMGL